MKVMRRGLQYVKFQSYIWHERNVHADRNENCGQCVIIKCVLIYTVLSRERHLTEKSMHFITYMTVYLPYQD